MYLKAMIVIFMFIVIDYVALAGPNKCSNLFSQLDENTIFELTNVLEMFRDGYPGAKEKLLTEVEKHLTAEQIAHYTQSNGIIVITPVKKGSFVNNLAYQLSEKYNGLKMVFNAKAIINAGAKPHQRQQIAHEYLSEKSRRSDHEPLLEYKGHQIVQSNFE